MKVQINVILQIWPETWKVLAEEQLAMRGGKDEQMATAVLGFINNNNIKQEYLYNQRKFFDANAIDSFAKIVYKESCKINKQRKEDKEQDAKSKNNAEAKEAEKEQ